MSHIFKKRERRGYTVVDNQVILDIRLSYKSKGIFMYLWSRSDLDGWDFNLANISSMSTDGKDGIRSGINELEKYGYIERIPSRKGGKFNGHDYLIDDTPEVHSVGNSNAYSVGFTASVKPTEISTNKTITKYNVETPVSQSKTSDEISDEITMLSEKLENFKDSLELATLLDTLLKDSNPKHKPQKEKGLITWAKDIEKLIRIDGTTPEEVKKVIEWIHTNPKGSFWIPNIKSGSKLRKQFETLWHQMTSSIGSNLSVKQQIEDKYTYGIPFIKIKLSGQICTICLFREENGFSGLYDYHRNKFLKKPESDKVWNFISNNLEEVLSGKYK